MLRWFRNSSILTKLLLSYAFLVIVPSVLVIYTARTTILELGTRDSIDRSFALSKQSAAALDATIDPLTNMSSVIRRNYIVRQICSGALSAEEKESIAGDAFELQELKTILESDMGHVPVTSVHVYTDLAPDGMYEDPVIGDFFLPVDLIKGSYWHGILGATNKTELYCPSFYLTNRELAECGELAYIEKLYPNAHISDMSPSYLVIYFSPEKLKQILEQDVSVNQGVSYIISERENIVTSSDANLVGAYYMGYDAVRDIAHKIEGYTTRTVMNEEVYASAYRVGESDWYMVTVMPSEPILSRGRAITGNFIIIYFATLTLALIFAIILSNSITKRIKTVNASMRNARESLPVPLAESKDRDEIGELVNSYNYMANEINALMEREKIAAENLRKTEIMALQAQINPHFLYNTMDMISWLAQTGKEAEVTHAVRTLSRFYKLTLSKKDIYTDLGSERDHVRLYLELQNMRYDGKINLIDDIPDELYTVRIPKLTLQPIVENSVLHGILEKDTPEGVIVLTAWTEGEEAVIMISDDGVGMDAQTVGLVLSGNTKSNGGTNIAVANIHRRLQILYGDKYGLTYKSTPGEGTEVTIRIPKEED